MNKIVKHPCSHFEWHWTHIPCVECLRYFDGIVPSVASILMKQHSICGGKYLLKTPGNAISETLNFKTSPDASALKNFTFGASSKAAYYSLSGCYLKTLLQPCLLKDRWRLKVFINNNTFSNDRCDTNSPLYSYRWKWGGWSWSCFDTILSAFLHVDKKRKEVCVKLGQPQPRSPFLKG